jgi:predicted GIY-YIG superfamily endonuclease
MSRMKTHSIYLVTNTINGKKYVGQTVVPEKRLCAHMRGQSGSLALNAAVCKFGVLKGMP